MGSALLEVQDLSVRYGMIQAVRGVGFSLAEGQSLAIVGANGAGKSSLLNALARLLPSGGSILLEGRALGPRADVAVASGLALVPEGRRVFPRLSVHENLKAGAYLRRDREVSGDLEAMGELFPRLRERMGQMAGTLSGGEQQMLAIARGLMSRPRILMVDEPSLGLSPKLAVEVARALVALPRGRSMAVIMVEQNARLALSLTDQAMVMAQGRVMLAGSSQSVGQDPRVEAWYLGG